MEPTKEQMYQWYVVEQKSYRQIMAITGIKNNRKIPKLLKQYGIEIRRGSDAVKTQWVNNSDRKKAIGETFKKVHKGKPSMNRIPDDDLKERMAERGFDLLKRKIVDSYTVLEVKCKKCGTHCEKTLSNVTGCPECSKGAGALSRKLKYEYVLELFDKAGVVLMDEYESVSKPMSFICPNHADIGLQEISVASLKGAGGACLYCKRERKKKNKGLSDRRILHEQLEKWRMAVYTRDNFICQCCGWAKGGILNAHHIKNFASHPHLRLDIDNGITLCEKCHNPNVKGSFHHVYGVRDNTEEQLREYIAMRQQNKKQA